jgi:hypothetical protein
MTQALHDKIVRFKEKYKNETTLESRNALELFEDIEALLFDQAARLEALEHRNRYENPTAR